MIDIKRLRDSPDEFKAAAARRAPDIIPQLDAILELDHQRRALVQKVEALKADRNEASEEVARRKKAGEDAAELLTRLKTLSGEIKEQDPKLRETEGNLKQQILRIPNTPLEDVPEGDPTANRELRTWGDRPSFSFDPKPHWELGERLGVLDLPRGAKIAGSGFPVYIGQGSKLIRSLINFMLDIHTTEHGYREMWPPALVNESSALATGQLPDLENNMYVTGDGLYLIPTAEVPVTNFHRDEVLSGDELPFGYAAYSPCFRREAGAHGKDTRGIIRIHQFDKVELVRYCTPDTSTDQLELLLDHAETVLQRLNLPYRVIVLATGDIGFSSAKTYDLEVWASGLGTWLEVSSASVFTDFQARRANIRYRPTPHSKPVFVHTLNASALALPRTIIALLENNQLEDGSVRIPEPLVPYMGVDRLTSHGG
ncbi:MAG: serine--tRNA ligase [Gemmatimonadetes bacterium]|nr:serine--tRNA ligase [Gemmatimonadota bacterium]